MSERMGEKKSFEQQLKERWQTTKGTMKKGGEQTRAQTSMYGRGSKTSSGSWQATAGAWAASQWRGAEGATPVTRERVTDAVAEVTTWSGSTGLPRRHTSKYLDDTGCPPVFICILI